MSGEERLRGGIVLLNIFDGAVKLCGDKGEKIDKMKMCQIQLVKEKSTQNRSDHQ
jgi:hypothetical protein